MKYQLSEKLKKESGYTLIELLLVLILMFLVIAGITLTYFTSVNAAERVINNKTSEIDARTALYIMKREIREANSIIQASQDSITFTSDINSDENYEEINYQLITEENYYCLEKTIDEGNVRIILKKIISPNFFSYYSQLEHQISSPVADGQLENIKIIEINISVDQGGEESTQTMHLNTKLTLRNKI